MIPGISGFSFFATEHIRKPGTTDNFQKLIFRGVKSIYLISSAVLGILCIQDKTLHVLLKVIKEHLLLKLEIDFFLLLKPKWYVDNKLVAFQQFSSNGKAFTLRTLDLESFLLIFGILENPETTENLQKLIFWGIKSNYLISRTFLSILCVQEETLKVLLKVMKEHLLPKLEIDFSYCSGQNGT